MLALRRDAVVAVVTAGLAMPLGAAAEPAGDRTVSARELAADGGFTPLVASSGASTGGLVVVSSVWNGARDRASLDVAGEVTVFGPLRVVARVDDVTRDTARPGAGVGVRLLDEARHGVAATAYLVYKAEGFTEPEGELEATAAFGRRLGPVRAALAITYGQDPEGNERDGEVAVLALAEPVPGVVAGLAGRYRDALGSRGDAGVIRDAIGGATATCAIDRFAITALAGVAAIQTQSTPITAGLAATVSIGAAF